jgi:uncharacterized protein YigA (DUF484 family)
LFTRVRYFLEHLVHTSNLSDLHRRVLQLEEKKLEIEIKKLEIETRVWEKLEAQLNTGSICIVSNTSQQNPNVTAHTQPLHQSNWLYSNIPTKSSNHTVWHNQNLLEPFHYNPQ